MTAPLPSLDHLLTWREASTSGAAIASALVAGGAAAAGLERSSAGAERIVLTGAGSSYYLAQAVASVARDSTGAVVLAVPLSELILRPSGVLGDGPAEGATRMRAAGHPTIALTCRADSPLAAAADRVLVSPDGDEQAIVMTRSFASMLALLLRAIAGAATDQRLAEDLDRAADRWPEAVAAAEVGRRLGTTDWRRVVILGGGPAYGLAEEWGLKLTETSQVPTRRGSSGRRPPWGPRPGRSDANPRTSRIWPGRRRSSVRGSIPRPGCRCSSIPARRSR